MLAASFPVLDMDLPSRIVLVNSFGAVALVILATIALVCVAVLVIEWVDESRQARAWGNGAKEHQS